MRNFETKIGWPFKLAIIYWLIVVGLVLLALVHVALWLVGLVEINAWRIYSPVGLAAGMVAFWYLFFAAAKAISERKMRKRMLDELNRHRPEGK